MTFNGSFCLGYNNREPRRTITVTSALVTATNGFLSNGTIIKGTPALPVRCAALADIDNTYLGVVMVRPEGIKIVAGDKLDIVSGEYKLDFYAYEQERLNEANSTKANLSTVTDNVSIAGNAANLRLVKVLR